MYKSRIETESGYIVYLDYEHGILHSINSLSGLSVELATDQSFQQIGSNVQSMAVAGVSRDITGAIIKNERATSEMLVNYLPPFTKGRLFVENETGKNVYADIVVEKTPTIYNSHGKYTFDMMVFCPYPYWKSAEETNVYSGTVSGMFSLPRTLNSYKIGETSGNSMVLNNTSYLDVDYKVRFTARAVTNQITLTNIDTLEKLSINVSLIAGDVVEVYRTSNRLCVEKNGENVFYALSNDSDLMEMHSGYNRLVCGQSTVSCEIIFSETYPGVIPA